MIQREDEIDWIKLSTEAWQARDNAFIFGSTKVGASVLSENQNVYNGCNVEHKFRSHDVHAEVNAITNMISKGEKKNDSNNNCGRAAEVYTLRRLYGLDYATRRRKLYCCISK